ncbi:Transmembrane protein, partial [Phytophthora megakarya]
AHAREAEQHRNMMQTQPLPTCDEYDPLDAHLDELEEPGANFLQDFIVAPQPTQSDTPLSNSNGYTSEESDYSVVTPSDEQNYQDMSFLQAANTSELVDVVGDISTGELTTVAPQQKFAGKVIKGKTSKYRGVTQTSKTSWGAKYSAKRITNTCKTPEEAAHAYDEYLKANYPQKYTKFANFCDKCGRFVNPLGLPQFQSECECSVNSPTGSAVSISPKKEIFNRQQITTPTAATPSLVPPTAPSPGGGPSMLNMMGTSTHSLDVNPAEDENATFLSRRSSNLSVGSLKFSFSEDTEQFFAESFNDVAKMSSDRGGAAMVDEQQQQQDQKRDSLPIAVISSAVDSFTQEDNLDQIIKDINRSSSSHSLLKGNATDGRMDNGSMGSFTATGSSSSSGKMSELTTMNNFGGVQEPATSNSLDFDVDELDELTKYFLSENDAAVVVQREMQANPALVQQNPGMMGMQNHQFKKIHSLDFDSDNPMTGSSSRSGIAMNDIKLENTEMMNPFLVPPVAASLGLITPPGSPPPAIIEIQTRFLEKYWRNDRKNIQCFPYCPEHGDYYRVRIENLQHRCKGVCRAPVKAHVSIPAPAGTSVVQPDLLVLARCNSTFSRNVTLTGQQSLSLPEMKNLQGVSAVGIIDNFAPLSNGAEGVQFDVTFHPDVWKFEFDLPKKRRHVQSSSPAVSSHGADGDAGVDPLAAEFLYFFEIDVFYSHEKTTFERLGHTESMNFQIGNTRTLLRQRNKMVEEFNSSGGPQSHAGQNDSDRLVDAGELPEKKKVKVYLGQRELLSGTSLSEDGGLSSRGLTGGKLSLGYITGEGVSSSSKRNLLDDKTAPMDVDGYFRSDSKDSIFDREAGSSELPPVKSELWKDVDGDSEDLQNTATSDYRPYVSPKQKAGNVQTGESPIATAIPIKAISNGRPVIPASSAANEAYSLPKLLAYSFVSVPLSVLFIPVGILLLLGLLVLPPVASGIVGALDALSDMELSRANSSITSRDQRMVLNRLVEEKVDGKPKGGMLRYHGKGEVWGRIFYFSGAKFVVSMVSLIPTFVLALLAGFLYPIRPASAALANAACSCALWSREYTRETTGKPLTGTGQFDDMGGLV